MVAYRLIIKIAMTSALVMTMIPGARLFARRAEAPVGKTLICASCPNGVCDGGKKSG